MSKVKVYEKKIFSSSNRIGSVQLRISQRNGRRWAIGVTTPISIERTTTQSSSVFDVYKKYLGVNTLGQTEFWTYSTHHALTNGALSTNYGYTKIYINTYESSMTGKQLQSTIAHEFGHAFGLSHRQTVPSSIMCQTKYGRTAIRASASDLQTINHLYA